MYKFKNEESVVLKLSRAEALGQLYIWNYSESGKTDCGVKELLIRYSLDCETWTDFGTVTLGEASQSEIDKYGGCVAANYGDPIDLRGVPAKYISLTPVSNHGGEFTGLSEVRVFRHKTRPKENEMICGSALNVNEKVTGIALNTNMEAALNNQGMSDQSTKEATHNACAEDMWYSKKNAEKSQIIISLDGTYPVKEIALWNFNDPSRLDCGIKEFKIMYTVGSPCGITFERNENNAVINETFDFSKGDWNTLSIGGSEVFTLPRGDGSDALSGFTLTLSEATQMQHVKIVPVSNYGGSGYGLSQVRFFAGSGWGVEPAREWTGLFSSSGSFDYQGKVYGKSGGWIGADGIYSVNLTGEQQAGSLDENSRVFMSFGDTGVGSMNNYKGFSEVTGYKASHNGWVNMSWLFLKGSEPDVRNAQFVMQGKDSDIHPYNNICAKHYWVGQTFLYNNVIYAQALKYIGWDTPQGAEGYDFLAIPLEKDGFADMNTVPYAVAENVPDQSANVGDVYQNTDEAGAPSPDGYVYMYSKKFNKWVVSRFLPQNYPDVGKWERYDGANWVVGDGETVFTDESCCITNYTPGNESGVTFCESGPFAGKYVNIYTDGSIFGKVRLAYSDSLTGPFSGNEGKSGEEPITLFNSPELYTYMLNNGYSGLNEWSYNAKAQPVLSKYGELLISYHIGVFEAPAFTTGFEYCHPVFYNLFGID